jgi:ribonuclease P protein component
MPTPQNNVGFVASKKVGNAVKRNRSKRRLRALFASVTGSLKLGTYIFVAKQPLIDAPFPKIDEAFITSLKRLKTLQR